MMTQKHNVPALRFPEFSREWKKKRLGNIAELTSSKRVYLSDYVDQGVPFYRGKEISELRLGNEPSDILYISEERYDDYKERYGVPQINDILITAVGTLGNVLKINNAERFYFKDGNLIWLRNITQNSDYLECLLQWHTRDLIKTSIGSTQKALTMVELRKLVFLFPHLREQQKISSFLTSVDTKIEQLGKKKALLEKYKKGMMQKLFSQTLRFKDEQGNDFPDWKEKRLRDISRIYDGTHQTPKYVKTGVPFYSVEHVTADQFSNTKFISEEVFKKENKRVELKKGDILMTRIGSIGNAKYIDWDVRASFYVSLALIKPGKGFVGKFLAQCITDEAFQQELWKRTIHVAFPIKINLGEIGNCLVWIPEAEEQQKIANFLSALDQKIGLIATELKQAKTFKKGLLQQMFV